MWGYHPKFSRARTPNFKILLTKIVTNRSKLHLHPSNFDFTSLQTENLGGISFFLECIINFKSRQARAEFWKYLSSATRLWSFYYGETRTSIWEICSVLSDVSLTILSFIKDLFIKELRSTKEKKSLLLCTASDTRIFTNFFSFLWSFPRPKILQFWVETTCFDRDSTFSYLFLYG